MKPQCLLNILPLNFRLKCLMDIEATIRIPLTGYFTKTPEGCRLSYSTGENFKYIFLCNGEEMAKLFYRFGIIDSYAFVKDSLKMYRKTFITIEGPKGEPIQMTRFIPVTLDDIILTEAQVQTIAAIHEYESNLSTIGLRIVVDLIANNRCDESDEGDAIEMFKKAA